MRYLVGYESCCLVIIKGIKKCFVFFFGIMLFIFLFVDLQFILREIGLVDKYVWEIRSNEDRVKRIIDKNQKLIGSGGVSQLREKFRVDFFQFLDCGVKYEMCLQEET